jgi:hypothetical protein
VTEFRLKNQSLVLAATEILERERPMTLRQLYYRLISAGVLRNDQKEYKRLGNVMTRLREDGRVPRTWIVDHVRSTLKPSSWTGLADFADTVRDAYRKDFWASLPHHVEVFVEKDAVAGTIQPVTAEYDIALRVCRGYSSVSFAGEIANLWTEVRKPIFAYYVGDFDPSGFDLERDLREKLERYTKGRDTRGRLMDHVGKTISHSGKAGWEWLDGDFGALSPHWNILKGWIFWSRLAVRETDFEEHGIIALPVKHTDNRAKAFIERHGHRCAEVDALPPSELRERVEQAILSHIDQARWKRLKKVEKAEQETLASVLDRWGNGESEPRFNSSNSQRLSSKNGRHYGEKG